MALQETVNRGAFIVIEGLDRSGKTTQVKRLEAELTREGKKVKVLRFPGNASQPSSQLISLLEAVNLFHLLN